MFSGEDAACETGTMERWNDGTMNDGTMERWNGKYQPRIDAKLGG